MTEHAGTDAERGDQQRDDACLIADNEKQAGENLETDDARGDDARLRHAELAEVANHAGVADDLVECGDEEQDSEEQTGGDKLLEQVVSHCNPAPRNARARRFAFIVGADQPKHQ